MRRASERETAAPRAKDPTVPSRRRWAAALVLVLATLCAYLPALPGDFLWDDDSYVTQNEVLRDPDGWKRVWTPRETPQFYPAVFTVLWLEFRLFGQDPLGYHLVNVTLHAASALLAWALFARLRVRGAWWIGAAFALHPLHVETVAWTMELKNVLSGLFYLLAAHAYLRFDPAAFERRAAGRAALLWLAATAAFALALLSKTVTTTLPVALVLALLWLRVPLRRGVRLLPLAPLALLGAWLALLTARLEAQFVGAEGPEFAFAASERLLIATRAALFYAGKLLWPGTLLFQYPRWEIDAGDPLAWWSVAAVLALVGGLAVLWARGRRGPLLAALYFGVTISPALGFVNFYPMIFSFVADHFCYLASLGVLAVAGALVARLPPRAARPVGLALLALLGARAAFRARDFSDDERLYRHTLEHHPRAWLAHSALGSLELNRATALLERGRFEEARPGLDAARKHFQASIAEHGRLFADHFNLALALERLGRTEEAVAPALEAARLKPLLARTRGLAGDLLVRTGRAEDALPHLATALELEPSSAVHLRALGSAYEALGRDARASELYRAALERAEDAGTGLRSAASLAGLLARSEDPDVRAPEEALRVVEEAAPLAGGRFVPPLEAARADALAGAGRVAEALEVAERLVEVARASGVEAFVLEARGRVRELQLQLPLQRRQPLGQQ